MSEPQEIWKPIEGWPRYEASSLGRIRVGGRNARGQLQPVTIMRPGRNRSGYLHVTLSHRATKTTIDVHRLVALAFFGPPPPARPLVNHKDGNKANCRVENLEYIDDAGNRKHADEILGVFPFRGARHPSAKLRPQDIDEIRKAKACGEPVTEIAQRYQITVGHAYDILAGKYWKERAQS